MMLALLDRAQIGGVGSPVLDPQAERLFVECKAALEIGDAEHDMA
jgi:hypothetical protein